MKKHGIKYDVVLFAILSVVLLLPMVQEHFTIFKINELFGVIVKTEKPQLSMESYTSGYYQRQIEAYLSENYGFREFTIRIYNQYLWDFYKKTNVIHVIRGKEGWLYFQQNVNDYYGTEMYRWQNTPEEAIEKYDRESRLMYKLREVLKDYGVEFMMFMAPEKGFVYSEYLPDRTFDTLSINAREYYSKKFDEFGFPYIEMTKWFQEMKDTVDFPLFPETGAHWNFSSVYGADSLFRFMGNLKGIELPKLKIGTLRKSSKKSLVIDYDLGNTMNILRPIRHRKRTLYEADVNVVSDSNSVKPKVLFVGNSFLWRINDYVSLDQVFESVDFWYYNSTAYFGDSLNKSDKVSNIDLLQKILNVDYVVWFTSGSQMYKMSYNFVERALLELCIDDSLMVLYKNKIADSLMNSPEVKEELLDLEKDSTTYRKRLLSLAQSAIIKNPELIDELKGDSVPKCRNKEILHVNIIEKIKTDSLWIKALEAQAFLRSATQKDILHAEADNIINGHHLLKDNIGEIELSYLYQQEVNNIMEKMRLNPKDKKMISKKAKKNDKSFEDALYDDAVWIVKKKHKLDAYKLSINPKAKIDLTEFFQMAVDDRIDSICQDSSRKEILYLKVIEKIKTDSLWIKALEAQAFLRSATQKDILLAEADNIINGHHLLKDNIGEIEISYLYQQEAKDLMEEIRNDSMYREFIMKKAKQNGKSFENALYDDAVWIVRVKYKLEDYGLSINPKAKIDLTEFFQMAVDDRIDSICQDSSRMDVIRNKALQDGKTLHSALYDDAVLFVKKRYNISTYLPSNKQVDKYIKKKY